MRKMARREGTQNFQRRWTEGPRLIAIALKLERSPIQGMYSLIYARRLLIYARRLKCRRWN